VCSPARDAKIDKQRKFVAWSNRGRVDFSELYFLAGVRRGFGTAWPWLKFERWVVGNARN
jgi:hypothetical protein